MDRDNGAGHEHRRQEHRHCGGGRDCRKDMLRCDGGGGGKEQHGTVSCSYSKKGHRRDGAGGGQAVEAEVKLDGRDGCGEAMMLKQVARGAKV